MAYRQLKLSNFFVNKKLETDVNYDGVAVAAGDGGDKDDGMLLAVLPLVTWKTGTKKAVVGSGDMDDKNDVGVGDVDDEKAVGAGDVDDKKAGCVDDVVMRRLSWTQVSFPGMTRQH